MPEDTTDLIPDPKSSTDEKLTISNLFEDIKERISSPFFSSFIISWLVINWKIPIVLFWYSTNDLRVDGYDSYLDFIEKYSNGLNIILPPVIGALFYCFAYPFLRDLIKVFNAKRKTATNDKLLKVAKSGQIDMMSYIRIKQDFTKLTYLLENTIKDEKHYSELNRDLILQMGSRDSTISKLDMQISEIQQANNVTKLNGIWEIATFQMENSLAKTYQKVEIKDGIFILLPSRDQIFRIKEFSCNTFTNLILFTGNLNFLDNNIGETHFYALHYTNKFDLLNGLRNSKEKVEFKKL